MPDFNYIKEKFKQKLKNVSVPDLDAVISEKLSKALQLPGLLSISTTLPPGTLYEDKEKGIKADAEFAPGARLLDWVSIYIRFICTLIHKYRYHGIPLGTGMKQQFSIPRKFLHA